MDAIVTSIEAVSTSLTALAVPLTVLSVTIMILGIIFQPILPDWARDNRGVLVKVLIAVMIIGWVPDLVAAFSSAGG